MTIDLMTANFATINLKPNLPKPAYSSHRVDCYQRRDAFSRAT